MPSGGRWCRCLAPLTLPRYHRPSTVVSPGGNMRAVMACLLALGTCLSPAASAQDTVNAGGPAQVRIVQGADGAYRMTRDGQPYYVRGAGSASGDLEQLAARGGNSFRTWSTGTDVAEVRAMLDRAQRNGLTVA